MIANPDIFHTAPHLLFQRHAVIKMLRAAAVRRTECAAAMPLRVSMRTGESEVKRNALDCVPVQPGKIVFQSPDRFHRAGRNEA